jgi:hypothetical protein
MLTLFKVICRINIIAVLTTARSIRGTKVQRTPVVRITPFHRCLDWHCSFLILTVKVILHTFEGNLLPEENSYSIIIVSSSFVHLSSIIYRNYFSMYRKKHLHQNSNPGYFLGVVASVPIISFPKQTMLFFFVFVYHN